MISKRELILLSAVAVASLVFVVDPLAPSETEVNHPSLSETQTFVDEQWGVLMALQLKPHEKCVLDLLQDPPFENPFARSWVSTLYEQKRMAGLSRSSSSLSFDGYIRQGNRFIALVNAEEYEVGAKLEHSPMVIREITPDKIIVENPSSTSTSRLSIKISRPEGINE